MKEGPGVYMFADKNVFIGAYKNNKKQGPGVFYWGDGSE